MRGSRIIVAAVALILLLLLVSPGSAWLTGWCYRQEHNITGSTYWTENQTNYVVQFIVNTSSGSSSGSTIYLNGQSQSDLDDLRFTDTSDTVWDYWIESTSNPYTVWVEVPSIYNSTTATQCYVYYGNSSTSSAYSNGTSISTSFDHFDDASINTTLWATGGTVSESSTYMRITTGISYIKGKIDISNGGKYIVRWYSNFTNNTVGWTDIAGTAYSGSSPIYAYGACIYSQKNYWGSMRDDWAGGNAITTNNFANWHTYEVIHNGTTSVYITSDGSTIGGTHTAGLDNNDKRIMFYKGYNTDGFSVTVDWIFNRKYIYPEPAHSTWFTEENLTPVTAFSGNVTSGYPPFPVLFTDASTNTPTTWNWTFETIGYSSSQNSTQWFNVSIGNTPTSYDVFLYANNTCGGDWENKSDYVTAYPLNASFYANITEGSAPLPVQFNSTITDNGTATAWWWDFTEDGVCDDANQTPTYTFTTPGLYNISLNVSNTYSWDWENKTDYVNVTGITCDPIVADFTSNVTEGYPEFTVQFTSTSTNATAWDWYFPNGGDSHTEVATWTFDYNIGNTVTTYNISLNASSDCDFGWKNETAYITAYPLNASFSMNATTGCNPLTVQFTDLTDNGTAISWNWSFDDGTYSDLQSPVHTFTSEDTFTVTLNSSNLYSWDVEEKVDVITVTGSSPVSDFTANVTEGYPAFAIAFTDTSTNSPDTWDWNFGDGETDVVQNPEHTYDSVIGNTVTTYTVSLNASNTCGNDTEQKDDYITAYPLNASFGANVTSGYQALPVQFTDYSDNGTATGWYYDFGDGNTCSTEQNPINIYTTTGGFTVLQNVSNAYSWDWENKTYFITVLPNDIDAEFTANVTSGNAPLPVAFTDTSTADGSLPDTWVWYVNDIQNSTTQNPVITFSEYNQSSPTCYTILLNASNHYDYDWENKSLYICTYPLNASFTANITSGCGPLIVEFTDLTDNGTPNWWNWSFGDGTYSDLQNPVHEYNSVATFEVTLQTKYGDYTFGSETKVGYISVTGVTPTASFTSNVTEGYPAFAVAFTDTTGAGPATYYWEFGDGETDNVQNPVHTYDSVIGNTLTQYTVNFNIDPGCGDDWENTSDYVTAYPLNASYGMNITTGCSPLTVQFTDLSDNGTATAWNWSFDDGTYSDLQNPIHTFTTDGWTPSRTFNVTLNVSNAYSWDIETEIDLIDVIGGTPIAGLSANATLGYPPFAIGFIDASSFVPTSWYWVFGDGDTDTVQNPVHVYDSVIGNTITTYTIGINASNACGYDWANVSNYITAYPLNSSFGANMTNGDAPLVVGFTSFTDNGTATNWWWDFNEDGMVDDTNESPTYIYATPGTYNVTMNASNAYSFCWYNLTDYITANTPAAPPVAGFTANVTYGYPNFTVQFTDTSTESPSDWDWYVDDVKVSDTQNLQYAFDDVIGNTITYYDIYLYAANGDGGDWENKSNYIVAYPLNASFSGNPTIGNSPLAVVFADLTDNGTPATWYWEFGDTGTAGIQNPGHTYNADGLYNVSLNASNTWSWDIEEKLYYINVTANYTPTPTPTTTTTVVVSGGQGTVSVSSATTGSGLTYPLIILGFGGIALVAVVGLVVFGIRRRRRNDEDDW